MNSPNALRELLRGIDGRHFGPLGLVNTNAIKDGRELVTVLCAVDLLRVRTKDIHTCLLQTERNVLRQLSYA